MRKKLLFIPLILAGIAALSAIVMLLWNAVLPDLFTGTARIDYWHALGLLILCRILFGGFKGRHGDGFGRERWKRWQAMTPEEREQFRRARGDWCHPQHNNKE